MEWENLDSYIESMYGWSQGEFDPKQFDKDALEKLRKEFGDGPVLTLEPHRRLYFILTK